MVDKLVNSLSQKIKNIDDPVVQTFKVVMEIHVLHEKLKHGYRSDDESVYLLQHYKSLAGNHTPLTQKMDSVFYDCRDIPIVHSIELDKTFPLIAYPFKLLIHNYDKIIQDKERKEIDYIRSKNPQNINEYVSVCMMIENLPLTCKEKLGLSFFV